MDVLGKGRIAMDTSPNNWGKKLDQVEILVNWRNQTRLRVEQSMPRDDGCILIYVTYFIFSAQDGSFFDKASNTVANEVKREVARCLPASESTIPTTAAYLSDNVGTKMTKKLPRIGRLKTLLSR